MEEEVVMTRNKFAGLRKTLNDQHSLIRQNSRVRWLKEGDTNTSYFHGSLSVRRRSNRLVALKVDDLWVEEVSQIKADVKKFFSNIYLEESWKRPL